MGNVRFLVDHWSKPCCENAIQAGGMAIAETTYGLPGPPLTTTNALALWNSRDDELPVQDVECDYDLLRNKSKIGLAVNREPPVHNKTDWVTRARSSWAYYEFPVTWEHEVAVSLLQGESEIMKQCYDGMLPATTARTVFSDASAPVPKIDGGNLPQIITVLATSASSATAVVEFVASAEDDCDSPPLSSRTAPAESSSRWGRRSSMCPPPTT